MHPAIEGIPKATRKSESQPEPKPVRSQNRKATNSVVISPFDAAVDNTDEVLANAARGEQLTDADISTLERSGLFRARDRERQVSRVRNILRHQELAGTKEERQALEQALAEAERIEREEKPNLERQIQELTRQLELLAKAPEEVRKKLQAMQDSVEVLRRLRNMPESIAEEYRSLIRLKRDSAGAIDRLKREVARCEKILESADEGEHEVFDVSRGVHRKITPELVEDTSKQRQQALEDISAQERMIEALSADAENILNRYVP